MSTNALPLALPGVRRKTGGISEVAALAWPAVLQALTDTVMQTVDSAIVGRIGIAELGAVGFAGIWVWTLTSAFAGAASGVQTFVAQGLGAGRRRECGGWVWQAAWSLAPAAALWCALVALVIAPLLALVGPSPDLHARAVEYAHARLWGAPAVVLAMALSSFFRGVGDTRTPLVATVAANLINAALTWALVFGSFGLPAWGVYGAGLATSIAMWADVAILAGALRRRRVRDAFATGPARPDPRAMRRLLRTGAPIGGQWVLDMIAFAIFTSIVVGMGDRSMAASHAMVQLLSFSFMQAYGISIASGALVGRYTGARDFAAAERTHRSGIALGLGVAAIVGTLFVSAPDLLLRVFTDDLGVAGIGRKLLALGALFQLVDAVGIVAGGSLRGAGDTRWPFAVQATLAWALRLPLVWLCAVTLDGGVIGAWVGELGYVLVLTAAFLLRFRAGAWRTVRI